MKNYRTLFVIVCLIMTFFYATSYAQTIHARFTTSVYSWQQQENDTSSANHIRAYQLAQLNIGNLGLQNLSFHTYLNISHDFADKAIDDPRLWIYNCYFNYRKLFNTVDFSIGRQRIYGGVGYGTIDGLQVKYRFRDYFNIKAYVGTLAPLHKSYEIEEMKSDHLSWGLHATTNKIKRINLGISYAQLSRIPIQYDSPGVYTGDFRLLHSISSFQKRLLGMDVRITVNSKLKFNGRLDYNLEMENVKRGEIGGRYSFNKNFEIGLDYIYRTPMIDLNSIFWVFDINSNQEIAFHTNYRWNDYRFFFNLGSVFFDGDDNLRIGLGCSWKSVYVGYHKRSGYGGESDGFSVNFSYLVRKNLNILLNSNLSSYKLVTFANKKEQTFAGSIGLNYNPSRVLTFQAETQLLRNMLFSHDFRFFLRASYAFSHRFK